MDRTLVVFACITSILYIWLGLTRPVAASESLDTSVEMFLQALPWIIVSMFAAGLIQHWLDPALLGRWLGSGHRLRNILIASILGLFGTGSRWAVYPLAAGMLATQTSPGSVFAFMTVWQLVSLPRLPAELPFLGSEFTAIRAVISFVIAIAGGLVIDTFYRD